MQKNCTNFREDLSLILYIFHTSILECNRGQMRLVVWWPTQHLTSRLPECQTHPVRERETIREGFTQGWFVPRTD